MLELAVPKTRMSFFEPNSPKSIHRGNSCGKSVSSIYGEGGSVCGCPSHENSRGIPPNTFVGEVNIKKIRAENPFKNLQEYVSRKWKT